MDELDVSIEFSRFPPEKQEQIRALVSYTTMMGLTGKDLISIGGKLDRLKTKNEIANNRRIIDQMLTDKIIRTVGKDKDMRRRWVYLQGGTRYYFTDTHWGSVTVANPKTGQRRNITIPSFYQFGRYRVYNNRDVANIMLNVHFGEIMLNF